MQTLVHRDYATNTIIHLLKHYYFDITTECLAGWYGLDCKQQCSKNCRENTVCDYKTGHCDSGCVYGSHGQFCNETCIGHCINNATCNQETGLCDGGCDAGWNGHKCNEGKVNLKVSNRDSNM